MNHQVQTSVLIDNEWVSRPIDAYQFMAQARDSDSDMPASIAKPTNQVPELGILSRTVFASPLFKSVRPANIRHRDLNDIILIGEDAVQLNEIHEFGRLRHVATKSDFKGRILAARVFGDPREIPVSVASPLPKQRPLHRGRKSMTGEEGCALPPEVMVLTLTSRTLMFLWARHTQTGVVTFSQRTVRLPAGASRFDHFGAFLAIDPKRRAMAVAAQEGRFILYKTKPMERWRKELRAGMENTPIEDERIIPVEGRVMHMDFLSSGDGQDEFHVVLLFTIALQGKTKITCFDWDCREDLSTAAVRTERVAVDYHDHYPSLLIPLSRTSDFLLVFETHITVYKDVLSGAPRRLEVPIAPDILPSLLPGDSKRKPRWVEWDKTPRNPDFPKEAFYVAREDGRIMYLERGLSGTVETVEAGDWPYRIDTAFACLSVDNSEFSQLYPDVLIAGGAGNDGRLCKLGSWPAEYSYASYPITNQLSYVDSISNWTPLTDLSVARPSGLATLHERDRCSIFVANGSSPHGEISELRHGLQSLVDYSFSGMNGCTGIWIVDHGRQTVELDGKIAKQHYATFAVTMPPETLLLRIVRTQREVRGEFSGAWEEGSWRVEQLPNEDEPAEDGVIRDIETLTACAWAEHFAVQITREEVRILHRPSLQLSDSIKCTSSLLLAACRPGFPFVAVTFREAGNTYLEIVRISPEGLLMKATDQGNKIQLDHDPTCIELFDVDGNTCVLTGTFGSAIYFLKVDQDGNLHSILEDSLNRAGIGGDRMILESASLLSAKGQQTLVCATRNGYLLSSHLPAFETDIAHFDWHAIKMGTTSAEITASTTDTSSAYVSCGSDFCRVRCSLSHPSTLEVDSIWFTNRMRPGYLQSPVTAIYQLPSIRDSASAGRNLGGFLFAVAGDEFHCSQLVTDSQWTAPDVPTLHQDDSGAVPRKLFTGAKPTSVTYLKPIRKMVVTTIEAKEGKAPPNGYRVLYSAIKLININDLKPHDEAEVKEEDGNYSSRHVAAQYELKHGERVYSVAEWPFTDHRNKQYNLIIVGTGVPGITARETGRRLIFNVGRNESNAKLQLKKESTFDHPVYCTAVYGNNETISAIGKTLTYDVFESEAGVLKKTATVELPSPAIHITIRAGYIYVSTLQHSHLCFVIDETNGRYEFKRLFTDSRERNCSAHLVVDISNSPSQDTIVLVNDKKSSSLTGLYRANVPTQRNAAPTVFEACLPRTVVRIQQGDIRPPWLRPATTTMGVLNDDIIGACSDGTIYTFSILSESARHLLRFIQNLVEEKEKRNPANQVSGGIANVLMNGAEGNQDGNIRALDVDPRVKERSQAGPKHKAIDGDLVHRWLQVDGNLEALLREGTEGNVSRIFVEFAKALWSDQSGYEEGLEKTKEWLVEVFMPVL